MAVQLLMHEHIVYGSLTVHLHQCDHAQQQHIQTCHSALHLLCCNQKQCNYIHVGTGVGNRTCYKAVPIFLLLVPSKQDYIASYQQGPSAHRTEDTGLERAKIET